MLYFWVMLFSIIIYTVDASYYKEFLGEAGWQKENITQQIALEKLLVSASIIKSQYETKNDNDVQLSAKLINDQMTDLGYSTTDNINVCTDKRDIVVYLITDMHFNKTLIKKLEKYGVISIDEIPANLKEHCSITTEKGVAIRKAIKKESE